MEESSAPVDSHSASFKIIEAIKEHPVLYINDVKGIDIKLADFRQKVWQFIADDLQLDGTHFLLFICLLYLFDHFFFTFINENIFLDEISNAVINFILQ